MVTNFFLAKKELFNDIKWDNELRLVEHSDYFIRLKTTKWKVLFTPDIQIDHHNENNSKEYEEYRNVKYGCNCISSLEKYYDKWKRIGMKNEAK
jgi:hypothetical protein